MRPSPIPIAFYGQRNSLAGILSLRIALIPFLGRQTLGARLDSPEANSRELW